ncbi:MAG: CPBP family glutamic-type intramembrane protease [Gemmatimonadota bacterium]
MPALPLPSTRSSYWHDSRAPRYSLSFALPLLILYEVLAAALQGPAGGVRNGADVILKSAFVTLLGRSGPLVFGALLIGVMCFLIVRDVRKKGAPIRPTFVLMFGESLLLATAFGFAIGLVTAQVISPLAALAIGQQAGMGFMTTLMVSLGAGLYEELLFRVLLVGALLLLARKVIGLGPVASGFLAVGAGALIFSAFHYVGPFADQLTLQSFVFRAIAGVAFSGLYVLRGFGITAWTHALYDILLLVVRG